MLLLAAQVGRLLSNLRDIHLEMLLVQDMELWGVLIISDQMEMESLRDIHWEMLFL